MMRDQVYYRIDGERDYQEEKWHGSRHEPAAFMLFMQGYLNKAIAAISTQQGDEGGLEELRKVVALGVACFEHHGVPERKTSTNAERVY